ncbi:S-type pyocin domain-containing protein [Erwinia tasmaniensis]|uniref:S-type pyocin domain-containing protein n=1 Tax=Erwinia tasmaniensis TaxID=338565 RepID=UPI003A4E275B
MSKKEGNPRSRDITPIYLGDGKFQFKGPQKACYLTLMNGGSWAWVMDRGDGGIAFCMPLSDREIKLALAMLGVSESPRYTPETVKAAEASLTSAGALALARAPGAVQLAIAGEGVMGAASSLLAALGRAASAVAAGAAGGIAIAAIFHSPEVGAGSDRVPGRDVAAMFAMPASTLLPNRKGLEPGVRTADLAVRASLVMSNGELALKLLKTGEGGLPSAVPVLTAVRDAATGLDIITLPAVAGQPPRTILINPAPGPSAPSNTGNLDPSVPVTPVHTGTVIKPVGTIQITTTPVADPGGMQDFVYWQPDASGSGVQPVYVVLTDPLDSGRYTRLQLDRKYKHAGDFGVTNTRKNSTTLTQFRDAIEAHLKDKDTIERGTYRREKGSRVYFNPGTMNVVVLEKNGDFLSGWKIEPTDDNGRIYLETEVL